MNERDVDFARLAEIPVPEDLSFVKAQPSDEETGGLGLQPLTRHIPDALLRWTTSASPYQAGL